LTSVADVYQLKVSFVDCVRRGTKDHLQTQIDEEMEKMSGGSHCGEIEVLHPVMIDSGFVHCSCSPE
jgi:hypothetical protein